jgi:hypothetical protein
LFSLFFKKVVDDSMLQIDESQASSYWPPVEDVKEPQPLLQSFSGITQLGKRSDERVQVRAKKASISSFDGRTGPKEVLKQIGSLMAN